MHRGEANTRATLLGDADPVVDYLQRHIVIHGEPHDACPGTRVSRHVGERLLRDTVDGHLDGCREVGKVFAGFNRHARLLTFLQENGVRPGSVFEVADVSEHIGTMTLRRDARDVTLGLVAAAKIRMLEGRADAALFHRVPERARVATITGS